MSIPEYLDCKNKEYLDCDYFISPDCPNSCNFAKRLKQGISHTVRTGLERFIDKWGKKKKDPIEEFLGIGAMTEVPDELKKRITG